MNEPPAPAPTRKLRPGCMWLGGLGVAAITYLLLWPVRIDPVAWTPPPAPPTTPNALLAGVERGGAGLPGPEDVAVDADGNVYLGLLDGRVVRLAGPDAEPETLAHTSGRPLGLDLDARDHLWIADADRGLLELTPAGELRARATEADGVRFGFTDDVDVAADGTVWFSDASSQFGVREYKLDLLEHRLRGRLLAYDPATRATRVALDGLQFANGVAVSADQRFVLVVETGKYRVTRLWLQGPRQGQHEVFVENLPGFPDGISARPDGGFWLALASPRDAVLDACLPYPLARRVLVRLPDAVQPAPRRHAWVLGLDADGRITHDLQDPAGDSYSPVTSAEQRDGWLYLGSLSHAGYARLRVPD